MVHVCAGTPQRGLYRATAQVLGMVSGFRSLQGPCARAASLSRVVEAVLKRVQCVRSPIPSLCATTPRKHPWLVMNQTMLAKADRAGPLRFRFTPRRAAGARTTTKTAITDICRSTISSRPSPVLTSFPALPECHTHSLTSLFYTMLSCSLGAHAFDGEAGRAGKAA